MQRKQCLHIIQNIEVLGEKKGKSSRKSKKGINHRGKDFKALNGKNMLYRDRIEFLSVKQGNSNFPQESYK